MNVPACASQASPRCPCHFGANGKTFPTTNPGGRSAKGMLSSSSILESRYPTLASTCQSAEGNQVNAEVNFEISKVAVKHSEGTLLRAFNINFLPVNPDVRPWYARF